MITRYTVYNNLFSPSLDKDDDATLFIAGISTDRTEIRAISLKISDLDLKNYANNLYNKLNNNQYFPVIYLNFLDANTSILCVNVLTEVLDGELYVTFKLYEPLTAGLEEKTRFNVLEQIGEPTEFQVDRVVDLEEEAKPKLKGPNFSVLEQEIVSDVTKYLSNEDIVSSYKNTESTNQDTESAEVSVDYEDFSSFIHFSSVAERLANFKDKLYLIQEYQASQDTGSANKLIGTFDHYEKHLYFASGSTSWPKSSTTPPYVNVPVSSSEGSAWYSSSLQECETFDDRNVDALTNTIPLALREDLNNDLYRVFVAMIGQHFDNEWLYAKSVADKYNADNRLDQGISKDLVKDALADLGVKIRETNQNLDALFLACKEDGTYTTGSESSVKNFIRLTSKKTTGLTPGTTKDQPVSADLYRKEVYKRIYHNLPVLLKTKGTTRGLRTLISCFGIPDNILDISIQGISNQQVTYFGPESNTTSSLDRIVVDTGSNSRRIWTSSGTGVTSSALVEDVSAFYPTELETDASQRVDVGFDLGGQFTEYVTNLLKSGSVSLDYDNIVGDPGDTRENYGTAFLSIITAVQQKLKSSPREFRSPSSIIRLAQYIDSTLLRTIADFISAKAKLATGVLVKDNILHRNKYKGVQPGAEKDSLDEVVGEIKTGFITGSDGGAIPADVPTNYTVTSKDGFTKVVDGEEPRYTGELAESEIQVSETEALKATPYNGKVVKGNPYKHATEQDLALWNLWSDKIDEGYGEGGKVFNPVYNNVTKGITNTYTKNSEGVAAEIPDSFYTKIANISGRFLGTKILTKGHFIPYIGAKQSYTEATLAYLESTVQASDYNLGYIRLGDERAFATIKTFSGSVYPSGSDEKAIMAMGSRDYVNLGFTGRELYKYGTFAGDPDSKYIIVHESDELPSKTSIIYTEGNESRLKNSIVYVKDLGTILVTDEYGYVVRVGSNFNYSFTPESLSFL